MREFNLAAYRQCDNPAKIAAINLMKARGYELESDLNKEYYKSFDLKFKNQSGKILMIENEFRIVFHKIKSSYDTIHIPLRKKDSQCDYYFIWAPGYMDVAIIKASDIQKCRDKVIDVYCDSPMNNSDPYNEQFIDVPKDLALFYTLNHRNRWKLSPPKK